MAQRTQSRIWRFFDRVIRTNSRAADAPEGPGPTDRRERVLGALGTMPPLSQVSINIKGDKL